MSRKDMDLVLNDGINTAVHFLEKRGEFYPFAVVKTNLGEIRHIQALTEDPRPEPNSVRESLEISLREGGRLGSYETVAIVSNVELVDRATREKSDSIIIEIDDIKSDPIICYIPYNLARGTPELGEIRADSGNRIAFFQ